MGNGDSKNAINIENSKNKSLSFNEEQFTHYRIDKIKPTNTKKNNHSNQKHISSSMDMKLSLHHNDPSLINIQSIPINKNSSAQPIEKSISKTMSKNDQKSKLQRLNRINDELRKQLIEINQKLTLQLQKKKSFNTNINISISGKKTVGERQQLQLSKLPISRYDDNNKQGNSHYDDSNDIDNLSITTLKKQLQSAYSQVFHYKKHLSLLKSSQSSQRNIKLQQYDDKLTVLDQQINSIQKSITSTRDIVNKQKLAIQQIEKSMNDSGVEENKKQIANLKQKLRDIKELAKKQEKDQKYRHQLLVQMERKLRQINGEYLPQIKYYNRETPQTIKQSRLLLNKKLNKAKPNNMNTVNQYPSNLQKQPPTTEEYQKAINEHIIAKRNYDQANRRIDQQLRKKNQCIQERRNILQQLTGIQKTIQSLKYKKERYLQSILQSFQSVEDNNNG